MSYAGQDFPETAPENQEIYGFDFARVIADGETIEAVVFTCCAPCDEDPDGAHLIGAPTITGTVVTQMIGGLLGDVIYVVNATITTSAGQQPSRWAGLPCVPAPC